MNSTCTFIFLTFFFFGNYHCFLFDYNRLIHAIRMITKRNVCTLYCSNVIWAMLRENLSSEFPTRSDTNQAVQSQRMARGWKFRYRKKRDWTICIAKTKALISCATAQLICVFVFACAKSRFLMMRLIL